MHTVVETPSYQRSAERAGLSEAERAAIIDRITANPASGDLIVGTGGARKLRVAGRGKGKSGGYRVITYFADADVPVFLLDIFSKGERVDLTQSERNELRNLLATMASDYRARRILGRQR